MKPNQTATAGDVVENAWRDIATAPRDGTWFLAYESGGECPAHYACQYYGDGCEGRALWASSCGQYVTSSPEPEFWQPLPTPPEVS